MVSFKGTSIVACGTLRREIRKLAEDGILDADRLLFTAPGLHEWPGQLEKQLSRQLARAREFSGRVIVAYGDKCFIDTENPMRDTDALLQERGPEFRRVRAKNCVDMLASAEGRSSITAGEKVYWLTPGWIENWNYIFKDWDAAKANETFPAHDRAVVLDAVGYFDELSASRPERVLEIADWMKIPLEARPAGLERLAQLLTAELD
jgi:hypothetical protein